MTSPAAASANKQQKLEERAMPLWQLRAIRRGLIRTCINCDYWTHDKEECKLAPGQRPPVTIIVLGCDAWMEEIPF
jgi:hypothetical protein